MVLKINKKGIGFFTLIPMFSLVLMGLMFYLFITPTNQLEDLNLGKITIAVDSLGYEVNSHKDFITEVTDLTFDKLKLNLIDKIKLDNSISFENEVYDISKDNFLSCKTKIGDENLIFWLNEKNYNYYLKNDLFSNDEEEIGLTYDEVKCLSNFDVDLSEIISKTFDKSLSNTLSKFNLNSIINSDYDEKKNSLKVNLEVEFDKTSIGGNAKIKDIFKLDKSYSLGNYPDLVNSIQNILPTFSKNMKSKVQVCVKNNLDEMDCILNSFKDLIAESKNTNGVDVIKDYNFVMSLIPNFKDEKYIALKFDVFNKKTKLKVLNFGIIIEDNIPFSLVKFELIPVEKVNNFIEVKIEEPKFKNEVYKYVIMYSYKNFFSSGKLNGYPYEDLLEILKNREIISKDKDKIFDNHYLTNENLDLDILLVDTEGFNPEVIDDGNTVNFKSVNIYQKFNYADNKFERLNVEDLYVFVFAIDVNNNFYVDAIDGKKELVVPRYQIGPKPISNDNILINGDLIDEKLDGSFNLKINSYDDVNFNHYNIYITLKNKGFIEQNKGDNVFLKSGCVDVDFECHYYDGSDLLLNKDLNLIVTSDIDFISNLYSLDNLDKVNKILTYNFKSFNFDSDKFILKNGETYEVYIVPTDMFGNEILTRFAPKYTLINTGESNKNFMRINTKNINKFPGVGMKSVLIKDNKAPNPDLVFDSEFDVSLRLNPDDSSLYLDHKLNPDEDVVKISGWIVNYDLNPINGNFESSNLPTYEVYVDFSDSNKLKRVGTNDLIEFKYSKVDFTRISFTDSNGNSILSDLNFIY